MSDEQLSFNRFSGLVLKHGIDLVKREVVFNGTISMRSLSKLDRQLKLLEIQTDPITLVINTPGGDVEAALGVIDRIRNSPCIINTIGTGIVMSAGIPILAAGQTKKASKYTRFMCHSASVAIAQSRIVNIESDVKYFKELDRILNGFLAENTKKNYSFWSALGKHVDYNFGADEALEYGLIDDVL